jgi:hypothetical protein
MLRPRTVACAIACCGALGGCFGDGGGGPAIAPTNESPGGIWNGTDSQTGLSVLGLATESGQFHFIRADGTQYIGQVTTSGMSGSGSFDGFAPLGATFQDGSTHGTGTVSGTVHQRSTFSATTQFTTDGGHSSSDTLSMTFNVLYNRPSSLATIAGNFTEMGSGTVFSVNASGVIYAQDAASGCVLNGTVSIIDASYNAYGVSIGYASCVGAYAVLNGLTLTGLGTLDNSVVPERAIIGLSGGSGTTRVALVETLSRS